MSQWTNAVYAIQLTKSDTRKQLPPPRGKEEEKGREEKSGRASPIFVICRCFWTQPILSAFCYSAQSEDSNAFGSWCHSSRWSMNMKWWQAKSTRRFQPGSEAGACPRDDLASVDAELLKLRPVIGCPPPTVICPPWHIHFTYIIHSYMRHRQYNNFNKDHMTAGCNS